MAPPSKATTTDEETKEPLSFDEVNHVPCPNCGVGVLHAITYDPDARHEIGQAIDPDATSGGAAQRRCFHCEYSDSVPLAPGAKYGVVT